MIPLDDLIRMARDAGLAPACECLVLRESDVEALEKFTNMVGPRAAAAEREACAQICDFNSATHPACGKPMTAEELASAIRARGAA